MFSRWKTRLGVALARWPGHYRSGEFSANAKSPGAEGGLSAIAAGWVIFVRLRCVSRMIVALRLHWR